MRKSPFVFAALFGVVLTSGSLSAQTQLSDVPKITEGVITIGMAYEITEQCSSISPRYLRANSFINELKAHARSLGFTRAQIEAYIDNDAEEARLEAIARQRLAALGVDDSRPETYCTVGRAEIAKGSAIGWLMR